MALKPPKAVVLACIAKKIDLAGVFCYEVTDFEVVLHLSGQRGTVKVPLDELPQAARAAGPPPEDTRAQPAPGKAEARGEGRGAAPPAPQRGEEVDIPPCDEVGA